MIQAGSNLVTVKTRRGYSRQSGPYVEYVYEGPRENIYGMVGELADADNWDLDQDGPKHTLKVRYASNADSGTTETPVDEVRLSGNNVSDSIYNLPGFGGIRTSIIQTIRAQMQSPDPGFNITQVLAAISGISAGEQSAAVELYTQLNEGVGHYQIVQPVLIRTRVASATFNFIGQSSAYQNVGSIIAPGNISDDAALGGTLLKFVLPEAGTNTARKAWGWLKHYPEYTQAAGSKAVLSQQYDFGFWNRFTYGDPI